jgi:hypothetical protein
MSKLDKSFELSRDASDYEITIHCRRRMDERPMLDFDIIGEAIEDGEVVEFQQAEGGLHNAVIEYDWLQSTFKVIVGVEDPKVQTAWEVEAE